MESSVSELAGLDLWLAIFFFVLTLVGPAFALIPIAFAKTWQQTDGGKVVIVVAVSGFSACCLGWQTEILTSADSINWFYGNIVVPLLSAICLGTLFFGVKAIQKMGMDGASFRVRAISFWIMLVSIPMGFAPIARLIDGDQGFDSTIQYFAEYLWRLSDMMSGGYISSFDRAAYSQIVVYTSSDSYSLVVFNYLVGIFVLAAVINLLRPNRFGVD